MSDPFARGGAVLSPGGALARYRYRLWRGEGPALLWVMLNPSTADASENDPTIRRVRGFTQREGFARFDVVNLFGYRASKPAVLSHMPLAMAVGDGDFYIAECLRDAACVVVAWGGSGPSALTRERVGTVLAAIKEAGHQPMCLGVTKSGHPRHPLYVRGDTPLQPFNEGAA